jgi:hypothetical protein
MGQYIQCEKCGKWAVELMGDEELACEECSEVDWDFLYEQQRDMKDLEQLEDLKGGKN